MKHKLLVIVLLIFTLFTCSCSREQDESSTDKITSSVLIEGEIETGTIAGDYIYRYVETSKQILLKYHIPSGTATTVCQDPFCSHGLTCPFAVGSSRMAAIGDILYYISENENHYEIRSYNGDDMKIKQVYTSDEGVLAALFTYNYYLYFTDIRPGENTDYSATVYRLDTRTNDILEIDNTSGSERIYEIKDKKIIWRSGSEYYSTDLNGNSRSKANTYVQRWGNYIYRNESNDEVPFRWDKFKMNLFRKNISSGEEELIATGIGPYYYYGDKIIYLKSFGKKLIIESTDRDHYSFFGGEVFVMNLDGSENRQLCNVDNCYISGFSSDRNNELVCGDWIGLPADKWYENNHGGKSLTMTDMLLVNIVTGEYKYAAFNPFE